MEKDMGQDRPYPSMGKFQPARPEAIFRAMTTQRHRLNG